MTKKAKAGQLRPAAETHDKTDSNKVGKAQLVHRMAEATSLSQKEAGEVFDTLISAVTDALRRGQVVGLPGLGTLSVRATAARSGVRPGTNEKITIPAGRKVAFKVSSTLKADI